MSYNTFQITAPQAEAEVVGVGQGVNAHHVGYGGWLEEPDHNQNVVYHSAEEELENQGGFNIIQQEILNQLRVEDPYLIYTGQDTLSGVLDSDQRIQEGILNSIEGDVDWAMMDDDLRGFNQTFDPPPRGLPIIYHYPDGSTMQIGSDNVAVGGGEHENMIQPEQNEGIVDSEPSAEPGPDQDVGSPLGMLNMEALNSESEANSDVRFTNFINLMSSEDTTEVTSAVNTELRLLVGNSSETGAVMTEEPILVGTIPLHLVSAVITRKGKELQAASFSMRTLEDLLNDPGVEEKTGMTGAEVNKNKEIRLFDLPEVGAASSLFAAIKCPSILDGFMGLANLYHESDLGQSCKEEIRNAKKRKCCTQVTDSLVPEDALLSVDKARDYLGHLAKKNCAGTGIREQQSSNGGYGFHLRVTDVDMVESGDSSPDYKEDATTDYGFAEVGPSQPPRSP